MRDNASVPEPERPKREVQELVTIAEIARRVVELGYAETMSKQRVSQLAKTDPNWPVPRDTWKKLGPYWQIPWPPVEDYFKNRKPVHGVHLRPKAQQEDDRDQ